MFAVPNGFFSTAGQKAKMKREGLQSGVPDICLPVARKPYNGLFLEMKAEGGAVSEKQRWWHNRLAEQGFHVAVCFSFDSAVHELENYLKG